MPAHINRCKSFLLILLVAVISLKTAKAQFYPGEISFLTSAYTGCDSIITHSYDTAKKVWKYYGTSAFKTYPNGRIKSIIRYYGNDKIFQQDVFFDQSWNLQKTFYS